MLQNWLYLLLTVVSVLGYPNLFETKTFRVGIEYDTVSNNETALKQQAGIDKGESLPMTGGSDRFRHRNNYDPFFVTIVAKAKNGYVITYLEVSSSIDAGGKLDFNVVRGATGSYSMTFQLVSNHSDFLHYSYITYGMREDKYKKVMSVSHPGFLLAGEYNNDTNIE